MWMLAFAVACQEPVVPCESTLGAGDQDCDGRDDRDADGDGADSLAAGGDDCDDADPLLNPGDADGDGASTCAGDCDDTRDDMGPRGVTTEVCDAMPSYIDANLSDWLVAPAQYCPWAPRVIAVEKLR